MAETTSKLHQLPKFPSEVDVITEETARFRSLSPEERLRSIRGMLAAGAQMMRQSPKSAFLKEWTEAQESLARQRVQEFIARHAS